LFSGGFFFSVSQAAAAALTNAMGGGRKFVSAICVRRLHHIAARDGSATRQFSVPKNSFQSMSTVSLLRALAGSGSISGNVSFGIPLVYSLHSCVVDGSFYKRIRVLSLSLSYSCWSD
jgi:hypothetical protein